MAETECPREAGIAGTAVAVLNGHMLTEKKKQRVGFSVFNTNRDGIGSSSTNSDNYTNACELAAK